jgi:hypothetical protein
MRILRACYAALVTDSGHLRRQTQRGRKDERRRFVYVAAQDREVWAKAEAFAEERGLSLSSVVADALARYLAKPPRGPQPAAPVGDQ